MEPWFGAIRAVVIPAAWAYFSWRFEDLHKLPRSGPVLLACNHASYLDPIANGYAVLKAGRKPRFLAKQELFSVPVVGAAARGTKQIPVRRGSKEREPLDRAEAALRAGEAVVIYPEGTVTQRSDGLPMEGRTGIVRLALATGVPITPMVSWGSAPVWQKSGRGSLRPRRPVWVRVGDPIDLSAERGRADDHDALRDMTARVMDVLTVLAIDLRDRYPKRWTPGG